VRTILALSSHSDSFSNSWISLNDTWWLLLLRLSKATIEYNPR
jgi:hypothetical protein